MAAHIPAAPRLTHTPIVHEMQREALCQSLDAMMRNGRAAGLTDQQVAEWLLKLAGRWLQSHGVSPTNIHQWLALALGQRVVLQPLGAEARTKNDFGGMR